MRTAGEAPTPISIVDALLALAAASGRRAPAVIVIEDLHWADTETIAAVDHLADRVAGRPLALVAALRPEGEAMARRAVARGHAELLALSPLDDEDVRALVSGTLPGEPPISLHDALAVAEGVPLLVTELLAAYRARSQLVRTPDGWSFDAPALALPPSLLATVVPRLAQLDTRARRVVEAAALLTRSARRLRR